MNRTPQRVPHRPATSINNNNNNNNNYNNRSSTLYGLINDNAYNYTNTVQPNFNHYQNLPSEPPGYYQTHTTNNFCYTQQSSYTEYQRHYAQKINDNNNKNDNNNTSSNWNYYRGNYPGGAYDWDQDPYTTESYYYANASQQQQFVGQQRDVNNNECRVGAAVEKSSKAAAGGYDAERKNYYWHYPLDASSRINSANNSLTRPNKNNKGEKGKGNDNSSKNSSNNNKNNNHHHQHHKKNNYASSNDGSYIGVRRGRNRLTYADQNSNTAKNTAYNRGSYNNKQHNTVHYGNKGNKFLKDLRPPTSDTHRRKKNKSLNGMVVASDDSDSFASPKLLFQRLRKG